MRKRTIDSAPTMPIDSATLDEMHMTTGVVMSVSIASVMANDGLYSTPRKHRLYTNAISRPTSSPSTRPSTISNGAIALN